MGKRRIPQVIVVSMLMVTFRSAGAKGIGGSTAPGGRPPRSRVVDLDLYVMSKCPFAARMMIPLLDVVQSLKKRVRLHVDYIATAGGNGIRSLHGPREVLADKAQLCVAQMASRKRYLSFLRCQYFDIRDPAHEWKACASKVGIPTVRLKACVHGPKGDRLLRASALRAKSKGVVGSPTLFINGARYHGTRTKLDMLRAVCTAMSGPRTKACRHLPKPVVFEVWALSDSRCRQRACRLFPRIVESVLRRFPGAKVHRIDYSSKEGRRLFRRARIKYLPALLYERKVRKAAGFRWMSRWLLPAGPYLRLRLPARFDPTKEICDNGIDDTHNGLVDCADPDCQGQLVCRPAKPLQLDMFVMSHCPFCNRAFKNLPKVLKAFGGRLRFRLHHVGRLEANGTFSSMHGPAEVEEDLREVCVAKLYSDKLVSYLACRAKNYRTSNWQTCARGMNPARIRSCAKGRLGRGLLARSFAFSKRLGIVASPTWVANNRFKFGGILAETICENIKKHNPTEVVDCSLLAPNVTKTGAP